jgi:monothiol glutaredoxin
MSRKVLPEEKVHPDALKFISNNNIDVVQEVISAIEKNKIVVVGMGQNPVVKKARKILEEKNLEYKYLSYGNYFSKWKQRLAIKLWSGWPTYPQVFVDGVLIGGCDDLIKFLNVK